MLNATLNEAPEFKPLTTTREERGRQIAACGGIRKVGSLFVVPSHEPNHDNFWITG